MLIYVPGGVTKRYKCFGPASPLPFAVLHQCLLLLHPTAALATSTAPRLSPAPAAAPVPAPHAEPGRRISTWEAVRHQAAREAATGYKYGLTGCVGSLSFPPGTNALISTMRKNIQYEWKIRSGTNTRFSSSAYLEYCWNLVKDDTYFLCRCYLYCFSLPIACISMNSIVKVVEP
jgi:hypothetical protein